MRARAKKGNRYLAGITGVSAFWSGGTPALLVQAPLNPAFMILPLLALMPLLARRLRRAFRRSRRADIARRSYVGLRSRHLRNQSGNRRDRGIDRGREPGRLRPIP